MCVSLFQIFFHYSELSPGAESEMMLGASVEFIIQNRQVHFFSNCTNFLVHTRTVAINIAGFFTEFVHIDLVD